MAKNLINIVSCLLLVLATFGVNITLATSYELPKVIYPNANPKNENKRILGKILFWEEQLATDNSIACGSCHLPAFSGADKRFGLAPGFDNQLNTKDDVIGSIGVVNRDHLGGIIKHPIYGNNQQVTDRSAQPFFLSLWANELFWDGRAKSKFIGPDDNSIVIPYGGALENQALGPLTSSVEMAKQGQLPSEIINKLTYSKPLALADNFPDDIQVQLKKHPNYSELFKAAFGDDTINITRIAMAIANYERSLIANQTLWDKAMKGEAELPYLENLGWEYFKQSGCQTCHTPPLFTDNKFYNIGIKGRNTDKGRQNVSLNDKDIGAMKVPSLRNVGLKTTYMHTGQFSNLDQVFDAYANVPFKDMASQLPSGEKYDFQFRENQRRAIIAFLTNALTDERVKNELFPFDRPKLRSELTSQLKGHTEQLVFTELSAKLNSNNQVEITWQLNIETLKGYDLEIVRNDGRHFWVTQAPFIDFFSKAGQHYQYEIMLRQPDFTIIQKQKVAISTQAEKTLFNKITDYWFHSNE